MSSRETFKCQTLFSAQGFLEALNNIPSALGALKNFQFLISKTHQDRCTKQLFHNCIQLSQSFGKKIPFFLHLKLVLTTISPIQKLHSLQSVSFPVQVRVGFTILSMNLFLSETGKTSFGKTERKITSFTVRLPLSFGSCQQL